uniref:Mandelate racemase/muconate lactonizing enzyme, C-terminal domain protein n=1 Tax=Solibacter usitatus (strain Ellin6076) TaxID=234267 RepID=Q01RM3_SOLUE
MNMKRRLTIPPLAFAPPQSAGHPLEIVQFHAWRLKEPVSGRRYTVVELQSRSGETGYGEGGPVPAAEIVEARAAIQGRRVTESEFVRARLAGIPAMEAAVGNAMLDLFSKSRKVPIYQFLGGPTRFKARLLARLEGSDEASAAAPLERAKRQGFRAFTLPALQRDAMIPLQEYVDRVRAQVAKMQSMGGSTAEWVLDGAAAMTPGDAATVAKALERVHMIWFDEPTNVLTTDGLAKITDESVMPIGLGRKIHDIPAFQNLLRQASVNVLRPGLGLNSLTKIKRIAALAETHYVAVAPYHEGGPIGAMAGVQLAAALANSYAVDVPVPTADRDAAMRAELTSGNKEAAENGFAALMNRPGLGFEVNRKALDTYSEERI